MNPTRGLTPDLRIEVSARLDPVEVAAVGLLVEAVTEADGVRPLDEHVMLHLRYGGDYDVRHVLVWHRDEHKTDLVVGYLHLDVTDPVAGSSAELAVHPQHRRRGIGASMVGQALAESPDHRLRLWSHGEYAAAGALARAMGFTVSRVLWQMRRSLYSALPRVDLPSGVALRTFVPGTDEAEWLELNARAFVDLPDQGRWTDADLQERMREAWFDPNGFLVAYLDQPGDPHDGSMVGFHWTKVHGSDAHIGTDILHHHETPHPHSSPKDDHDHEHAHEPIGEVYVVGVDPRWRGTGLGRGLTVAGLHYLRNLGLSATMLYVDATNTRAIRLYESLGFNRWDTDVQYQR